MGDVFDSVEMANPERISGWNIVTPEALRCFIILPCQRPFGGAESDCFGMS